MHLAIYIIISSHLLSDCCVSFIVLEGCFSSELLCSLTSKILFSLILFFFNRENLLADCLQGCFVVTCTLCAFISLVWLREQIVHGGAPQWLEQNQQQPLNGVGQQNEVKLSLISSQLI